MIAKRNLSFAHRRQHKCLLTLFTVAALTNFLLGQSIPGTLTDSVKTTTTNGQIQLFFCHISESGKLQLETESI